MSDESARRAAIDRAAAKFQDAVQKSGGSITHEAARERVTEAVRKGDQKRSDSNR